MVNIRRSQFNLIFLESMAAEQRQAISKGLVHMGRVSFPGLICDAKLV